MCKNEVLTEDNLRGVIVNTSGIAAYDGQCGKTFVILVLLSISLGNEVIVFLGISV